jgi:hypothetical protein
MGRNNVDFQKQILIHRGLRVTPDQVDLNNLGEYWTSDPEIAKQFAGNNGTVITGIVDKAHTIPSEWDTRKALWEKSPEHFDTEDDYSGPDPEKEVRVHPDKVNIIKVGE